jgi:hypothetical protein
LSALSPSHSDPKSTALSKNGCPVTRPLFRLDDAVLCPGIDAAGASRMIGVEDLT